jgi:isocitrate dehydrogenase kinase/phosphatase
MIWGNKGSNVDLPSHAELDGLLSDLHFMYDSALDEWHEAQKERRDVQILYNEKYAEIYDVKRLESDKITAVKKDTEMNPSVRKLGNELLRTEGAENYCDRILKKIESQRSMAQSRIKLLLSQTQWDRSSPE